MHCQCCDDRRACTQHRHILHRRPQNYGKMREMRFDECSLNTLIDRWCPFCTRASESDEHYLQDPRIFLPSASATRLSTPYYMGGMYNPAYVAGYGDASYIPYAQSLYIDPAAYSAYYGPYAGGQGGAYRGYPQPQPSPPQYRRSRSILQTLTTQPRGPIETFNFSLRVSLFLKAERRTPSKDTESTSPVRQTEKLCSKPGRPIIAYRSYSGPRKNAKNMPMYRKKREPNSRIQTYQILGAAILGLVLGPMHNYSFYVFVTTTKTEWQSLVVGVVSCFAALALIMLATSCLAHEQRYWQKIDYFISIVGTFGYLLAGAIEAYFAACYPPTGERIGYVCHRAEWIIATVLQRNAERAHRRKTVTGNAPSSDVIPIFSRSNTVARCQHTDWDACEMLRLQELNEVIFRLSLNRSVTFAVKHLDKSLIQDEIDRLQNAKREVEVELARMKAQMHALVKERIANGELLEPNSSPPQVPVISVDEQCQARAEHLHVATNTDQQVNAERISFIDYLVKNSSGWMAPCGVCVTLCFHSLYFATARIL
uniref:MARVEL domain-containing protein n=1 Tax=Parascaris equorum TaxID=6256 RepID=A0A914S0Z7_PAREQ